ncbi:MAG: hypothetical protein J6Y28_04965 [Acholeplasmatales bacterium]|nr:hypothetical protein [Methanobrevibacter sp.]MBP5445507.1 hypothetical protein [Acholeplasmatales bacterium]
MGFLGITLLIMGILFANLIIFLFLIGIYNLINAFIEDVTGTSLSEKIKEKMEHKNE